MSNNKKRYFIGTSGFQYGHWKDNFYPSDVPKRKWFEYYRNYFDTVELNTTFYHLPKQKTVESWSDRAGKNFVFALKASRYITHVKRLKDPKDPLKNFFDAVEPVKGKTGPVLFQLPGRAKKNFKRLENFLDALDGYNVSKVFELRNPTWWDEEVYDLLNKHNVCLCWYSMPDNNPPEVLTADFLYIRMHGAESLYQSSYSDKELEKLAKKIYKVNVSKVFVYFNNDNKGYAVKNALKLKEVLNVKNQ
ncbi:MAG: DUF72 domain-containing protein [Elusimicrobiota bacterium]